MQKSTLQQGKTVYNRIYQVSNFADLINKKVIKMIKILNSATFAWIGSIVLFTTVGKVSLAVAEALFNAGVTVASSL